MYYFAAASLDLNEAWNLSWGEGIQFILVLAFVYWLKKRIDFHFAKKQSKIVYKVKIVDDSHISVDHAHIEAIDHAHIDDIGEIHGDVVTHPKKF
tara:strand:+ start:1308 stop:1592 length:285 start_codon:yes stop_codon:yes gene_type:complete